MASSHARWQLLDDFVPDRIAIASDILVGTNHRLHPLLDSTRETTTRWRFFNRGPILDGLAGSRITLVIIVYEKCTDGVSYFSYEQLLIDR